MHTPRHSLRRWATAPALLAISIGCSARRPAPPAVAGLAGATASTGPSTPDFPAPAEGKTFGPFRLRITKARIDTTLDSGAEISDIVVENQAKETENLGVVLGGCDGFIVHIRDVADGREPPTTHLGAQAQRGLNSTGSTGVAIPPNQPWPRSIRLSNYFVLQSDHSYRLQLEWRLPLTWHPTWTPPLASNVVVVHVLR